MRLHEVRQGETRLGYVRSDKARRGEARQDLSSTAVRSTVMSTKLKTGEKNIFNVEDE